MKAIRFSILAALMVLLASCQDELFPSTHVKEGLPTTVDFSISVPAAEEVAVTKASVAASESEIRELMLIMFEQGGRKMVLDLKPYMDAGTVTEGYRKYTLTRPIDADMYGNPVLSGTYRVYAIANWSSSFSSLSGLDQLTEGELKEQIATNPGFVYNISGSERFPMSSITENVVIELEGKSSLQIKLKRLMARIEFEFKNGTNATENPNFIPTSYTIYNIPSKANLFSKESNAISGLANADFGKSAEIALSSKSFEFFMLENVQTAKQAGCDTQAKREQWTGGAREATTSPENKNFIYAPNYGTFVVVKGTYTSKSYIGDASFTIHLGNFSEKTSTANGKDYSNFKVNRNERQIYKVTVNGVNSIVTEVTDQTEGQPGAEGDLAETAQNVFVLDAHYEKVMMDLSDLKSPAYLFVDTPYCQDNKGQAHVDLTQITKTNLDAMGLDYKWVKFIKPSTASDFPTYNSSNAGDIHDLVNDIIAGTAKYYTVIEGKTMTAAFVDEYFYEKKPDGSDAKWTEFVNTDNRTMSIRPGIEYSQDGNSSLVQNSHIELSQRSIKTTYAFDGKDHEGGDYVPFGIETWDETWAEGGYFYTNNNNTYSPTGLTDDNGWNNTKILTNGVLPSNTSKAGYLTSISDNSKASHVYKSYSGGLGYNACLLRNRDENNDGRIGDDELKWYLPSIEQYLNIWLSEDLLHEDTQLFDRNDISKISNDLNKKSVYYTSSESSKRLYWSYEGASYGEYNSSWANASNRVRCVRNVVATANGYASAPSSLAFNDKVNRIISVDNITAVRRIDHVGEYGVGHTERMQDNLLPRAFEVAKVYLGETITLDEPVILPEETKTWLKPGESVEVTYTRSTESYLGIFERTYYTFTIKFAFTGVEGATYSSTSGNCTKGDNNIWTISWTPSRGTSTSGETSFTIRARLNDGSVNNVTVNVVYRATNTSSDGNHVGSGTIEYRNTVTTTGGLITEIKTGKGTGTKDSFGRKSSFASIADACATGYYQEYDSSDLGTWRVPNQRELMLMLMLQDAEDVTNPVIYLLSSKNEVCTSSTYITNSANFSDDKTEPYSTYNSGITSNTYNAQIYIRCVRDAQPIDGDDSGDDDDDNTSGGGITPPVTPPVTPPNPGTEEDDM